MAIVGNNTAGRALPNIGLFGSQSWTPAFSMQAYVYVIGGGGSGAASDDNLNRSGGGGAAGCAISFLTLLSSVTYTVTIGAGGAQKTPDNAGANGGNSSLSGSNIATMTANGGTGGAQTGSAITGAAGGSSQTKGFDFLGAASSTSRSTSLDKETMKKIKKFIQANKGKDSGSDIGQLKDSLVELYGPKADGKGGAVAELKDTIQAEVQRKVKLLKGTEDPWLRDLSTKDLTIDRKKEEKRRKYVSLGKIFSRFLGLPIASTG